MSIPYHMRDEAASEALLAAYEATLSFDQERGVPEAAWIAMKVRWGIKTMLAREYRRHSQSLDELEDGLNPPQFRGRDDIKNSDLMQDLAVALASIDPQAARLLILYAMGYPIAQLSHEFKATGPMLQWRRTQAMEVLRNAIA